MKTMMMMVVVVVKMMVMMMIDDDEDGNDDDSDKSLHQLSDVDVDDPWKTVQPGPFLQLKAGPISQWLTLQSAQ